MPAAGPSTSAGEPTSPASRSLTDSQPHVFSAGPVLPQRRRGTPQGQCHRPERPATRRGETAETGIRARSPSATRRQGRRASSTTTTRRASRPGTISSSKTVSGGKHTDVYEISAAVAGGMSGGPTINVGRRSHRRQQLLPVQGQSQAFNFVRPIELAQGDVGPEPGSRHSAQRHVQDLLQRTRRLLRRDKKVAVEQPHQGGGRAAGERDRDGVPEEGEGPADPAPAAGQGRVHDAVADRRRSAPAPGSCSVGWRSCCCGAAPGAARCRQAPAFAPDPRRPAGRYGDRWAAAPGRLPAGGNP